MIFNKCLDDYNPLYVATSLLALVVLGFQFMYPFLSVKMFVFTAFELTPWFNSENRVLAK